ncbi:unnamed protein product [Durusdinium trenchii]|uniref:Uncharacterized protein n=3 Tax=Durusdinium trenchii TaxID=1381693 RepID=A0ABP0JYR4_9DINO
MLSIQKELASRSLAPSLRVVLASAALRSLRRIPTRGFASRRSEQKTKDSEGQGESAQSEEAAQPQAQTFGEKFVVFGLALRGMALLPRFAPAAQLLRVAGVGPMAVGAVVSLYELGGWPLLLAVPGTATLALSASVLVESNLEEQLRADVLQRLSDEVPPALLEALRSAEVKSFETNRCKIEAQIRDGGVSWHLEVRAERRSFPLQWQLTNMQVRTGRPSSQKGLPPQTRDWKPQEEHLEWTTVAMSE